MNYFYYYYLQTDVICLVLLGIVLKHSRINDKSNSASQRYFAMLILSAMVCTLSDFAAAMLRGMFFPGARIAIQLSNMLYLESISVSSLTWFLFVFQKMGVQHSKRTKLFLRIPFLLISLLILSNPLTNFMFSINEENLYVRGNGVPVHWVASWFYMVHSTCYLVIRLRKEKSKIIRSEITPMIRFIIAPAVAATLQMFLYGLTTSQVGITVSVVMICLSMQDNMISQDELTGISNRKELNRYVEMAVNDSTKTQMIVVMIDINKFKRINDTYGHAAGDITLIVAANALKRACDQFEDPPFLCRYGGDEFVITGYCTPAVTAESIRSIIHSEIAKAASDPRLPCPIDVSIGSSIGNCETLSDFDHHLRLADESMYDDKKHYARSH